MDMITDIPTNPAAALSLSADHFWLGYDSTHREAAQAAEALRRYREALTTIREAAFAARETPPDGSRAVEGRLLTVSCLASARAREWDAFADDRGLYRD